MTARTVQFLLSCEHATHHVPAQYRSLFRGHFDTLKSHRGWDPGTLALGRAMQRRLACPLFETKVSRLLIEVNRSTHHPCLFSEFSKSLPAQTRQKLLQEYYLPYRTAIETRIRRSIGTGHKVIHISVHSFAPQLNGEVRNADVALLYDPSRRSESHFCNEWIDQIKKCRSDWKVRRNYPYRGVSDGLTTYLRKQFDSKQYLGIELEVNQNWMISPLQRSTNSSIVTSLDCFLTA